MDSKRIWLRSWRGLVLASGAGAILAVGLVGWATSVMTKPKMENAAWLMIDLPQPALGGETESDRQLRLDSWRDTQKELVLSPNVLGSAVEKPQIRGSKLIASLADPIAWLHSRIKVADPTDVLFTISMPGESQPDQALIVNAVTEAYLDASQDWESGRQRSRIEEANAALADYRQTLFSKRKALRETPPTEPEQAAALRDEIIVLEEVARRLGVAAEQARLEAKATPIVKLIAKARP